MFKGVLRFFKDFSMLLFLFLCFSPRFFCLVLPTSGVFFCEFFFSFFSGLTKSASRIFFLGF